MRRALLILLLAFGATPSSAWAHAQLEGSTPERGATAKVQPKAVTFSFSEPVETAFGAVRVFDAKAGRIDDGTISHPGGKADAVAVGLRPGLPDGTYTATYRVVSADGHPVSGGLVFSVGKPGAGPAASVDELLGAAAAGTGTKVAAAAARAVLYGAIAVVGGLLVFLWLCWRRALQAVAGAGGRWRAASEALARRAVRVGLAAAGIGTVASFASLAAEGATAGGTSVWAALDPGVLREVAGTRTGRVLVGQLVAWLALAGVLASRAPRRAVALRPATLGADGQALATPGRLGILALALPAVLLVLSPALEGHQTTQDPIWANFSLDVVHVTAITTWLGGIVALLLVVPAATKRLEPPERTRLLAALLVRFSPIALRSVLVVALSGTVAAVLELDAFADLLDAGYGRAILIKASLLLVLVALGAVNRQRVVPRLRALAGGEAPGRAGHLLRRTLRAEVAVLVVVLGVTGALVGSSPPGAGASGPFSERVPLGPLDLEVTVDPARTGPNELHVYLFDKRTGTPFGGTKELTLTATQQQAGIGPLPVTLRSSGPGHFTADTVAFAPGGTWQLAVRERVSEFDQYETKLEVEVR